MFIYVLFSLWRGKAAKPRQTRSHVFKRDASSDQNARNRRANSKSKERNEVWSPAVPLHNACTMLEEPSSQLTP